MANVRLIHWNDAEGVERQSQLEALGFDVAFGTGDGSAALRSLRSDPPKAVVIDFSIRPSHGREVGRVLRMTKATRLVPLVFVGGEPRGVEQTRSLLPDATYTTWGRVGTALARAVAKPLSKVVVPVDVMSAKPTVLKLGVKPGHLVCLIGAPPGFGETLTPLPANARFTAKASAACDLFVCFARASRELPVQFARLAGIVDRQTLWLAWPKKASGVKTDLTDAVVRSAGLATDWVDFKVCAIDATWSGLAFKKRTKK